MKFILLFLITCVYSQWSQVRGSAPVSFTDFQNSQQNQMIPGFTSGDSTNVKTNTGNNVQTKEAADSTLPVDSTSTTGTTQPDTFAGQPRLSSAREIKIGYSGILFCFIAVAFLL